MIDNNSRDNADREQDKAARAQQTKATTDHTKATKAAADEMYRYYNSIAYTKKGINKLAGDLKDSSKSATDLAGQFARLKDMAEDLEDATEKEKDAIEKALKAQEQEIHSRLANSAALNAGGVALKSLAQGVASSAKSLANSYQGGASAFQFGADLISVGADTVNGGLQGVASIAKETGGALSMMRGKAAGFGVALELVGAGISAFGNSVADTTKFVANFLAKELDNTVKSFNQASTAGALFANGLTDLRNAAAEAMLTPEQFSKVIAENSEKLSMFGGTVSNGVSQFTHISKAMEGYRHGLMNLGLTTEEIADGQASYMKILALSGQGQRRDYANMAKEIDTYLTNLRDLTNLTGENVKDAAARGEAAVDEGQILAELTSMGGDAKTNQLKFSAAISGLPKEFENMFKQQFMYKSVTGDDQVFYYQANVMRGIMESLERDVRNGSVSQEEMIAHFKENIKAHGAEIQAEGQRIAQQFGQSSVQFQQYQAAVKAASATMKIGLKSQNLLADETKLTAQGAKETNDKLTNSVSDATVEFIKLKATISKDLTGAITQFSRLSVVMINDMRKALRKMGIGTDSSDVDEGFMEKYGADLLQAAGGAALVVVGGALAPFTAGASTVLTAIGGGMMVDAGLSQANKAMAGGSSGSSRVVPSTGTGAGGSRGTPGAPGVQGAGELKDGVAPYVPAGLGTNGKQGKGLISKELADKLFGIAGTFPGATITSLNDADIFPDHDASKSKHGQGKAIDLVPQDKDWFKYKDYYVSQLTGLGFPFAQAEEKGHKSANGNTASGAHLHAELANGGVTRGPSLAGEAGPEAVIPLPDGRRIPVKMDTSDLIDKLNELLSVMKDQLDTSDKIHRAVA